MKILLLSLLISFAAQAAPAPAPQAPGPAPSTKPTTGALDKKAEPSAVPCPPQKTRTEKLDDLAKLEGQGESHSTNCPAQGAIQEAPQKSVQ